MPDETPSPQPPSDSPLDARRADDSPSMNIAVKLAKGTRVRVTLETLDEAGRTVSTHVTEVRPGDAQKASEGQAAVFHVGAQPASEDAAVSPVRKKLAPALSQAQALLGRWKWSLGLVFFGLALLVYLGVRFVGLQDFPIYFFTDEAVQTLLATDWLRDDFRNYDGVLFPTYFRNGYQYNLSLSVYAQVLPYLLFGKSVLVTRGTSVLITLVGAVSVGLLSWKFLKLRYWWSATLLLSMVPAWFLHSRTAFETAIATALYAGFLLLYLLYRCRSPQYLYAALIMGALTFYAYSPAQVVVVATGALLLVADFRYHWTHRAVGLNGVLLLALLALPYVRFRFITNPGAASEHLRNLSSYWIDSISIWEKLKLYGEQYWVGLSPGYWYVPNEYDLQRHLMRGYGHIMLGTLPFALLGLVYALKNFRDPAYRTVILALLAAPTGGAVVRTGITRSLIFIIPATLLTVIGVSLVLQWLQKRVGREPWLAAGLFAALAFVNVNMTRDALVNGPTWYDDYGLGGMQYGGRQLFGEIEQYFAEKPGTSMIVSPTWANGTIQVARFFLPDPMPIQLGSVEAHINRKEPLSSQILFVVTPREYEKVLDSGKFSGITVEKTLPYPDGSPGFYFIRLAYDENVDALFEQEAAERRTLLKGMIFLDGQPVQASYSRLDIGQIENLFDGDTRSLGRTEEANPAVIELVFPEPRELNSVAVMVGSMRARVTVRLFESEDAKPLVYSYTMPAAEENPTVEVVFPEAANVKFMHIEIKDMHQGEPHHLHIWEVWVR